MGVYFFNSMDNYRYLPFFSHFVLGVTAARQNVDLNQVYV